MFARVIAWFIGIPVFLRDAYPFNGAPIHWGRDTTARITDDDVRRAAERPHFR